LPAIRLLNETLHHPPAIQQGNHSIRQVFTQSGSEADLTALKFDFRFTPESGLKSDIAPCPVGAKLGPRAASELGPFVFCHSGDSDGGSLCCKSADLTVGWFSSPFRQRVEIRLARPLPPQGLSDPLNSREPVLAELSGGQMSNLIGHAVRQALTRRGFIAGSAVSRQFVDQAHPAGYCRRSDLVAEFGPMRNFVARGGW
jgi:hypothetical protein